MFVWFDDFFYFILGFWKSFCLLRFSYNKTMHSSGKIIYFNQSGLDEYVVLYPPTLVNILRSFITDEMFYPEDGDINKILKKICENGKISREQLHKVWAQEWVPITSTDVGDFIINLLVHLDILIVPRQYKVDDNLSCQKSNEFLVPCVI